MPQCLAIMNNLDQCPSNARNGEEYCGRHMRFQAGYVERFGAQEPLMCHFVNGGGRCEFPHEPDQMLCMHHRHQRERAIQRRAEEAREEAEVTETYEQYMAHVPRLTWQEVLTELMNRSGLPRGFPGYLSRTIAGEVAHRYFANPEVNPQHFQNDRFFWRTWAWLRQGGPEQGIPVPLPDEPADQGPVPVPPPVPRLQALAADGQNVHTREVSDQTNESTRKLLEVVVPLTQKTEQTLMLAWYALPNAPPHHKILKAAIDINKWFNTETCRQQGDKLYKHVLRGLVAYINQVSDKELKEELWKRAFEECSEAVGMCCEGHISRLCNVLVGFDEAFKPPVSFAEILQAKMAAIAGMDVALTEKIQQANTFFNEYAVPQEQRQAWLDAISVE